MRTSRKRAFTGFGTALLFILGFVVYLFLTSKTVVVSGDSMLPTLRSGQRLLTSNAYWLVGPVKVKDIVVLRDQTPTGYIIKRVYRTEGQVVDWYDAPTGWDLSQGEYRVPKGHIYVLGDNREVSEDSRKFGAVPMSRVIGKIVIRQ